jgi:GAF domain-containing protein
MKRVLQASRAAIAVLLVALDVFFVVASAAIFALTLFGFAATIANMKTPNTTEKAILMAVFRSTWLPYVFAALAIAITLFLFSRFVIATQPRREGSSPKPARQADAESLVDAEELLDETIEWTLRWARELNIYIAGLPNVKDHAELHRRLNEFVNHRLVEAGKNWLSRPKDGVRFGIWLANEKKAKRLEFGYGSEKVTEVTDYFDYGEGLAGHVYAAPSRAPLNVIDPAKLDFWKKLSKRGTFSAILVVLIEYGDHRLGVLCVDRRTREQFDARAVGVVQTLAAILGAAMALTEERGSRLRLDASEPPQAKK